MDEALEPGQTFFEFTNGPLLYALADVPLPVFIMETVYLSTDTIQTRTVKELEAWRSAGRLPYVVMRQNLPVADRLDGVDNALRAYRVAEYLYAHYQPCFRVSGLDVWAQRSGTGAAACRPRDLGQGLPPRQRPRPLKPLSFEQALYFGQLPYYWALLDEVEETLAPAESFKGVSETARRRQSLKPGRAENPCFELACYLDLDIYSERQQRLEFSGGSGIVGSLQLKPGRHQYRLRFSTLWHVFRARRWPALSLEGEARFTLYAAALQPLSER